MKTNLVVVFVFKKTPAFVNCGVLEECIDELARTPLCPDTGMKQLTH